MVELIVLQVQVAMLLVLPGVPETYKMASQHVSSKSTCLFKDNEESLKYFSLKKVSL